MTIRFFIDINKVLKKYGITQQQLADITGISKTHISTIRSKQVISFRTLNKMASGLREKDITSLVSVELKENQNNGG